MREQKVLAKEFEFYFPDLDNMLLVESLEDGTVRVRFSTDNLSENRKVFFIRRLATEGFIPDSYQSYSRDNSNGVSWVKDYSWLKARPVVTPQSNRFMWRLIVVACILWMVMMRILLVSDQKDPPAKQKNKNTAIPAVNETHAGPREKSARVYLLPESR